MGEDPSRIRAEIEQTRAEMGDTVDALGYKSDVKSRTKDKMSETKDRLTGRVTGAKDIVIGTVSDKTPDSGEVKGQAQRAASVAQENPLGLAIGGIAVGFLAGLLFPPPPPEPDPAHRGGEDRPGGRAGPRAGQADRARGARARQGGRPGGGR